MMEITQNNKILSYCTVAANKRYVPSLLWRVRSVLMFCLNCNFCITFVYCLQYMVPFKIILHMYWYSYLFIPFVTCCVYNSLIDNITVTLWRFFFCHLWCVFDSLGRLTLNRRLQQFLLATILARTICSSVTSFSVFPVKLMWTLDCQDRDLDHSFGRLLNSFFEFLFTCGSDTRFLLDPRSGTFLESSVFSLLDLLLGSLLGYLVALLVGSSVGLLGSLAACLLGSFTNRLLVQSWIGLLDRFLARLLGRLLSWLLGRLLAWLLGRPRARFITQPRRHRFPCWLRPPPCSAPDKPLGAAFVTGSRPFPVWHGCSIVLLCPFLYYYHGGSLVFFYGFFSHPNGLRLSWDTCHRRGTLILCGLPPPVLTFGEGNRLLTTKERW